MTELPVKRPSVGRIVWFWPKAGMTQPHAAIITHVWNDTLVNLSAFDSDGNQYSQRSVFIFNGDPGEYRPQSFFCEWPEVRSPENIVEERRVG